MLKGTFHDDSADELTRFILQLSVGDVVPGRIEEFLPPLLIVDIGGPISAVVDPLGLPDGIAWGDVGSLVGTSREFVVVRALPGETAGSASIYLSLRSNAWTLREDWEQYLRQANIGDVVFGIVGYADERGASIDVESIPFACHVDYEYCASFDQDHIVSGAGYLIHLYPYKATSFKICGFDNRVKSVLLCPCEGGEIVSKQDEILDRLQLPWRS